MKSVQFFFYIKTEERINKKKKNKEMQKEFVDRQVISRKNL